MRPFISTRPHLTQNAVYWPAAGVYLKSTHVHDYQGHEIELVPGLLATLAVDGGNEYRRVVSSGNPVYEDFCLWSDSPFELVAERLLWGTHGPKGDQPRRWVPLKECETDHLQAILKTQLHIYGGVVERVIKHILKERGVKPAVLEIPGLGPIPKDIPRSQISALGQLCQALGETHLNLPQKRAKTAKKPVKRKAKK